MKKTSILLCLLISIMMIFSAATFVAYAEPANESTQIEETEETSVPEEESEEEPEEEPEEESKENPEERREEPEEESYEQPGRETEENYNGNTENNNGGSTQNKTKTSSKASKYSSDYSKVEQSSVVSAPAKKNLESDYDTLAKVLLVVFIIVAVGCIVGLIVFNYKYSSQHKKESIDKKLEASRSHRKKTSGRDNSNEFKTRDNSKGKHTPKH